LAGCHPISSRSPRAWWAELRWIAGISRLISRPVLSPPWRRAAERSLRDIAITRKNFLFLGSDAGGERAAVLYTILQSAKLNGLNPEVYLADVIDRLAKGHPINRLSELLPWNWKQKDDAPDELESAAAG
jgi:IS66 C-terminal element